MNTTTNDPDHDLVRDIHATAPSDCRACRPVLPVREGFACLSHTCPDCGAIAWGLLNDRNELIHDCCRGCLTPDPEGPRHFASSRCQSGRRPHCTCDTCF